jgi:hypothetical protein
VSDSLLTMQPTDATILRNFLTQPYGCEVRKGYVRHATGLGFPVETLIEHINAQSATPDKLFAFAGPQMFDVTDPGDQVRTPVLTGLSNARWYHIGVANASGYNVAAYNGADDGIWIHDNGTISRISLAVNPVAPTADEIAGVDPKKLIGGCLHQKRMWLIQKESAKAWYLAPEAITGQAYEFDFGSVFTRGGRLVMLASWTRDSGVGPDDLFVAISSVGEIAIYSGTDPSSASTWQLKGVFYTGSPLSRRAVTTVAGDLLVLTQYGLLSMNAAMNTSDFTSASSDSYLSNKIQYLVSVLASELQGEFGWDLVGWPDTNLILVNVPLVGQAGQLVQSTITKGWSQWDNMDAECWCVVGHKLFFGGFDGSVYRAWEGYTDGAIQSDADTITKGTPIVAQLQTAFNYYGALTTVKHAKMARPVFMNSSKVPYRIRANPDFDYTEPQASGATLKPAEALWNRDKWNAAEWSGGVQTQKLWTFVSGIGAGFALRLYLEVEQPVLLAAYDFIYEDGRNI